MRRISLLSLLLVPLPLLAGCPAEVDSDRPPGCECIVDEDDANPPYDASAPTCGEELCSEVAAACPMDSCEDPSALTAPSDALACALTALRDRTPGVLRWSVTEEIVDDQLGYLLIREDGTAVRRDWGRYDLEVYGSDAVLGKLPPPEHFEACLAESSVAARFECLRAELESQDAVCDMAWSYDSFS